MYITDAMIRAALSDGQWLSARQIARRVHDAYPDTVKFDVILYGVRNALARRVVGISRDVKIIPETEESVYIFAVPSCKSATSKQEQSCDTYGVGSGLLLV